VIRNPPGEGGLWHIPSTGTLYTLYYASVSDHSRGMALNREMAQGLNVTVAMMFLKDVCLPIQSGVAEGLVSLKDNVSLA
jgi:hypothetical protein